MIKYGQKASDFAILSKRDDFPTKIYSCKNIKTGKLNLNHNPTCLKWYKKVLL